MSKLLHKTQCPRCLDTGRDNLGVYDDGHSYCFACGFLEGYMSETVVLPKGELIAWESRGFAEDIMREAGVYSPYVEGSDVVRGALVFPYYDPVTNKLTGYKVRDLDAERKKGKKVCYVTGKQGLFVVKRKALDTLVITEGEPDVLTLAATFPKSTVIGLPGSSTTKLVRDCLSWVRGYKKIYLCLDTDTPGKQATDELVSMLPGYKTFKVNLDKKDATEYLENLQIADLKKCFDKAEQVSQSVLTSDDEALVSTEHDDEQHYDTGIDSLNAMLGGGLHLTELMGLVGHTGRGKSQLAAQIAYNLVSNNNGLKCLYVCTEMTHRQMVRRFSQIHLGKRYNGFTPVTKQERQQAENWVYSRIRFNRYELTDPQEFYDASVQAILEDGIRVVFIDVVNDLQGFNADWASAAETVQLLKKLAEGDERENIPPCAVVMVCHTSGRDDELSLDKIRGGSAIRQRITCAVGLRGEVNSTDRELVQLKQSRNFSIGVVDTATLTFNTETTRYAEVKTSQSERSELRLDHREFDTPSVSASSVPPKVVPLRTKTEVESVPGTNTNTDDTRTVTNTTEDSVQTIHTGLSVQREHMAGSEGSTDTSRRDEDVSSTGTVPEPQDSDDADVQQPKSVQWGVEPGDTNLTATQLAERYAQRARATGDVTSNWWQSAQLVPSEQASDVVTDRPSELVTSTQLPVSTSTPATPSGSQVSSRVKRSSLRKR